VRILAIHAFALAAAGVAACGGGHYQGSGAGAAGSNAGGSADNPGRSAGATSSTASGSIARNPVGATGGSAVVTSGSPSGSGVRSGVAQSGTIFSSGAVTSGASTGAAAFCRVPAIEAGSLPFVVDTAYHPTGWMGDAPAHPAMPADPFDPAGIPASPATTARMQLAPTGYAVTGDACTPDGVGRSTANAKGGCWKVTYIPFPKAVEPGWPAPDITRIGSGPGYGWAGAFWQYPLNNWGNLGGGYPIPAGATTVSFWARGSAGGERVRFFTGEGLSTTCSDFVATAATNAIFPMTPAWTHYAIDITGLDYSAADITPGQGQGGYFGGVIGAFGFSVGDQTLPSLDGGTAPPNESDPDGGPVIDPYVPDASFPPFFDSTITFYIDDIEFQ
jgi:hypothetical protein